MIDNLNRLFNVLTSGNQFFGKRHTESGLCKKNKALKGFENKSRVFNFDSLLKL
jgi:hypothetical protein